ncbi:hypothetical protein LCGC14_2566620, partial [marine sediment metagenome]
MREVEMVDQSWTRTDKETGKTSIVDNRYVRERIEGYYVFPVIAMTTGLV